MDRWSNLNMEQKAQLLGIYASKGYTDLASIINHYNTFQAGGKLTFNEWKSQMQSKYPDIDMDNTKAGYDYVRYFNDNYDDAIKQLSELGHFPDTYKLPNHKTFSNESIYSRGPMIGGNWVNDSTFSPSIINRRQYPNIYKEDRPYTEREIYGDKYQQGGRLYQEGGPFKIGYTAPPISSELKGAPVTSPAFSTKKLVYGSNEATRARVREKYPVINQVVDSVAKAYDLNPSVLNNRVDSEGLIDRIAQLNDEAVEGARDFRHNWQTNNPRGYDFPTNGFHWYGLDDVATLIEQGKVQPINEVWEDEWNENEKGRRIHSASGKTWVDNIGLMGATLKYFRSLVEKDFPGKDDKFYDEGALAYWNRGHTGGKKYMQGPRTDSRYKTFSTGGSLGHITPLGQWQYPHQITTIPSNNITMKGVNYPVIGVSNTGDTKYMLPNMDYLFDGNYVTEYPLHKH